MRSIDIICQNLKAPCGKNVAIIQKTYMSKHTVKYFFAVIDKSNGKTLCFSKRFIHTEKSFKKISERVITLQMDGTICQSFKVL